MVKPSWKVLNLMTARLWLCRKRFRVNERELDWLDALEEALS